MGGRGSVSATAGLSYQGSKGANHAHGFGTVLERKADIQAFAARYPNAAKGADETLAQIAKVSLPNDTVTMYRAAPSYQINPGDWVFLSRSQAERWASSLFTGKRKAGVNVIEVRVPVSQVEWTEKNLEFAYTGKRPRKGPVS